MSSLVNLDTFINTPLKTDPFPYLVLPGFVKADALPAINNSFPHIDVPGSLPLPSLKYGAQFKELINELEGPEVRAAFAKKFNLDLSNHPTMVTARGLCREKDGQIHTDSRSKIITVLLYLNPDNWNNQGGRLRLLRSGNSLDDMVEEVDPQNGTIVCFLNTDNAWHGHGSYAGPRRVIQLNWVQNQGVVNREQKRHKLSAFVKKLKPF